MKLYYPGSLLFSYMNENGILAVMDQNKVFYRINRESQDDNMFALIHSKTGHKIFFV